jgi:hypothetical protein
MGGSSSKDVKEGAIVIPRKGHSAQIYHEEAVKAFLDVDDKDIYQLFGLDRYTDKIDLKQLEKKKKELLREYHPDKVIEKKKCAFLYSFVFLTF